MVGSHRVRLTLSPQAIDDDIGNDKPEPTPNCCSLYTSATCLQNVIALCLTLPRMRDEVVDTRQEELQNR